MSSHSDPTGALLLGIGAGVYMFYKGFRTFREYNVLEDTPRMPIRSVPMGFAHISGKAQSAQLLTSPLSKTPCCFYRVEIDQWKTHDRSSRWEHICTDADGYRFYVQDDTGRVLVDAHAAEYDLTPTAERVVSSANAAPAQNGSGATDSELLEYVTYAQGHHMVDAMSHWLDNKLDRAREGGSLDPQKQQKLENFQAMLHAIPDIQKTGQVPLALFAKAMAMRGPAANPEKEARRQFMLSQIEQAQSTQTSVALPTGVFHQQASGRFRLREYVVVPDHEYFVTGTCVENPSPQDSHDRNLIVKGKTEPTFLISSQPDQQATKKVGRSSFKLIFGGAALTLVCLALLLLHLKMF
jgi:E3 Ubiquitin ligase